MEKDENGYPSGFKVKSVDTEMQMYDSHNNLFESNAKSVPSEFSDNKPYQSKFNHSVTKLKEKPANQKKSDNKIKKIKVIVDKTATEEELKAGTQSAMSLLSSAGRGSNFELLPQTDIYVEASDKRKA